jgi:hypothetical protein
MKDQGQEKIMKNEATKMFPISGSPFFSAAQGVRRTSARPESEEEPQIEERPSAPSSEPQRGLLHPATAAEFRQPLQAILSRLPLPLLRAFVEQGYVLHVLDTTGLHPLTLEVPEVAVDPLWSGDFGEGEVELVPLHDGGATTQDEVEEWLALLQHLNPDLDLEQSSDTLLWLPRFRYWHGRRYPRETVEFLRDPGVLLGTDGKEGRIAGMVLHGTLPGWNQPGNRILFWDHAFRRQDPLLDWYVLHELGHTTDYSLAFAHPALWRRWKERLEAAYARRLWFTDYAGQDAHEYFAEGFAAWCTPQRPARPGTSPLASQRLAAHRARLEELDGELVELIEEAVYHLIQ